MRNEIYLAHSYVQKGARLGDPTLGLAGGKVLVDVYKSEKQVRSLLRRICLEDKLSVRLFHRVRDESASWEDLMTELCMTRSRWCRKNTQLYGEMLEAFAAARQLGAIEEYVDADFLNLRAAMTAFFRATRIDKHRQDERRARFFREMVQRKGIQEAESKSIIEGKSRVGSLRGLLVMEIEFGHWEKELEQMDTENCTPSDRAFLFDHHLGKGKQRMVNNWGQIAPGRPMPAKLDLRWCGASIGQLWRHSAFAQFGTLRGVAWESVVIPEGLWEKAIDADCLWLSPRLGDALIKAGHYTVSQ